MKKINKKYLDDPKFRRIMNSLMNIELTVVATSGYFDPLHVGHIEYLEEAKKLGDKLVVIVNNDEQARLKKGKPFMAQGDRLKIVKSLLILIFLYVSLCGYVFRIFLRTGETESKKKYPRLRHAESLILKCQTGLDSK